MNQMGFLSQALLSHRLFDTDDIDEARSRVGDALSPHDLTVLGRGDVKASMYRASMSAISLIRLDYSEPVEISRGCIENSYLVQIPLSGSCLAYCGDKVVHSNPKVATVVTPTMPIRMVGLEGVEQFIVKIERATLERYCGQLLGSTLSRPVEFDPSMSMASPQVASLFRLIELSMYEMGQGGSGMLNSPIARANLEQMLVHALLYGQPNSYSDQLHNPSPSIAPHYVKRAEEYISAHADQPIGIADIAEQAGVSVSALYAGFKSFRSLSPMAFLKSVRLQNVHEALLNSGAPSISVTDVAMQQGFRHLGHFSAAYKRMYGEAPSDTLRRARGSEVVHKG